MQSCAATVVVVAAPAKIKFEITLLFFFSAFCEVQQLSLNIMTFSAAEAGEIRLDAISRSALSLGATSI